MGLSRDEILESRYEYTIINSVTKRVKRTQKRQTP